MSPRAVLALTATAPFENHITRFRGVAEGSGSRARLIFACSVGFGRRAAFLDLPSQFGEPLLLEGRAPVLRRVQELEAIEILLHVLLQPSLDDCFVNISHVFFEICSKMQMIASFCLAFWDRARLV